MNAPRGRPPKLTVENVPERFREVKAAFAMPHGIQTQVYRFPSQTSAWASDAKQYPWRIESGVLHE